MVTNILHTFPDDLDITLTSPAGTVVTISSDNAGANDNVFNGTTWNDDASPGGALPYVTTTGLVNDHPYVLSTPVAALAPEEGLGAFIGENPNGVWTLRLSDDAGGEVGTLTSWSLNIQTSTCGSGGGGGGSGPCTPTPAQTFNNTTPVPVIDLGLITSTIVVAGGPTYIMDLDMITNITHTFPNDLDFTITSPGGTVVTISSDNAGTNDNAFGGTTWDDKASPAGQVPYSTGTANGVVNDHPYVVGTPATPIAPEEAFAAFIGENANGTWTLTISDGAGGDAGTLNSWSLVLQGLATAPTLATTTASNTTSTPLTDFAVTTSTITISGAGTAIFDVDMVTNILHTFPGDLDITLTSPAGTIVTITTDNAGTNDNVFNGTTWNDDASPGGTLPYVTTNGLVNDHPYVLGTPVATLAPEEGLGAFIGENPNGLWTLRVYDDATMDVGTLTSWSLNIQTSTCGAVIPCVLTCPANVTVSNSPGQCGAVVNFPAPTTTGPCGAVSVSPASGSFFPIGNTTVTATVAGGGPTCTFVVRVNDTQAPTLTCPSNISTTNTAGTCTRVVTFTVTGSDNCPGVTVVSSPASGSSFPIGTTTINNTATDAAGNISTCSFTVTVTDSQLPVITVQPVNRVVCSNGNTTFNVIATNAVSYQWQVNGTDISGATGSTLTLNNVTNSMNGNVYRVVVRGLCTNVTSGNATLAVNSLPTVSLSTTRNNLSPGFITSIIANYSGTPGTFAWYRNNVLIQTGGLSTLTGLDIDSLGVYKVVFTDLNGCVATSAELTLKADPNFQFFVYPSPNSGQFQVRFYSYILGVKRTLNVFDSKGAQVFRREFTMTSPYEKMAVDVTRYSQGLYHVELRDAAGKVLGTGTALYVR